MILVNNFTLNYCRVVDKYYSYITFIYSLMLYLNVDATLLQAVTYNKCEV